MAENDKVIGELETTASPNVAVRVTGAEPSLGALVVKELQAVIPPESVSEPGTKINPAGSVSVMVRLRKVPRGEVRVRV